MARAKRKSSINLELGIRRCSKCEIWKPLDEFYKETKGQAGIGAYCKECRKIVNKEYMTGATHNSVENRARHVRATQEHFMRKYGVPYKPSPKKLAQLREQSCGEL